jgi:D-glycero-D-manno-heptose 1,7-bisphosphate phosphatase
VSWQAIFLDRDGTLNRERADYVKAWAEFEWLPGARAALAQLAALGAPIIIVTNQAGIGRGMIKPETIDDIHRRLQVEAEAGGGRIDRFLVCPHTPAEQCGCRKPQPGLLLQAAAEYGLDLRRCVMIGDSLTDYLAAERAGCQCVMVRTGRQGNEIDALLADRAQVSIVNDIMTAVAAIAAIEPTADKASVA